MKRLLLVLLFAALPYGASAQTGTWQMNPTQPSLLLFAEAGGGPMTLTRSGVYKETGSALAADFTALLELPASEKSNILLKLSVGHHDDQVVPGNLFGTGHLTSFHISGGFGVRFLWGGK